jgi:hypothetical protein
VWPVPGTSYSERSTVMLAEKNFSPKYSCLH